MDVTSKRLRVEVTVVSTDWDYLLGGRGVELIQELLTRRGGPG